MFLFHLTLCFGVIALTWSGLQLPWLPITPTFMALIGQVYGMDHAHWGILSFVFWLGVGMAYPAGLFLKWFIFGLIAALASFALWLIDPILAKLYLYGGSTDLTKRRMA